MFCFCVLKDLEVARQEISDLREKVAASNAEVEKAIQDLYIPKL